MDTCQVCQTINKIYICHDEDCSKETVKLDKREGQWVVTGDDSCHAVGDRVTCYYERDNISNSISYTYEASPGAIIVIIICGLVWIGSLIWLIIDIHNFCKARRHRHVQTSDLTGISMV